MKFGHWIPLALLAVAFTIALTFASVELPRLLDSLLQSMFEHPAGDSHSDDLGAFKRELFIQHYHIRLIGYVSFAIVILLIAAGFMTRKMGLASLGAFALFLPVFAQFAGIMFFLAGLGILNLMWMPILDVSFDILRLGDIVYVPYRILAYIGSLLNFDVYRPLTYILIGLGLLLFMLGTLAWLYARFQRKDIADFWLYRISRHPQYLGWIIWGYGLLIYLTRIPYPKRSWGIPSSLPWLLSTMVIIGVAMLEELKMKREEGEEYKSYLRRTPFMFPLPGFISRIMAFPMRLIIRKEHPEKKREVAATIALYTVILILLSAVSLGFTNWSKAGEGIPSFDKENRVHGLIEAYKQEKNRLVRSKIASSLVEMGEPAVDPLIQELRDENSDVRPLSAELLGKIGSERAVQPLIEVLEAENSSFRYNVINALGKLGSEKAIQPLMVFLKDEDGVIRGGAAEALGKIGSEKAVDALIAGLTDEQWYVRIANANALGRIGGEKAVEPLIDVLKDENVRVRQAVAMALLRIESEKAVDALNDAANDEDWEVRFYAKEALRRIEKSGS